MLSNISKAIPNFLTTRKRLNRKSLSERKRTGKSRWESDHLQNYRTPLLGEDHIHPVVAPSIGVGGETTGRSVPVHTVASALTVPQSVEVTIVDARSGKVVLINRVVSHVGMVGSHIDGVGSNRHWVGKVHLLPARGGLVGESRRRQQLPATAPQIANVGAGIGTALVEPDAGDETIHIRAELDAYFNSRGIGVCGQTGCRRVIPQAARCRANTASIRHRHSNGVSRCRVARRITRLCAQRMLEPLATVVESQVVL